MHNNLLVSRFTYWFVPPLVVPALLALLVAGYIILGAN